MSARNKKWVPVVIESPYSGDVERNKKYLQRAIRDCRVRGESPYASHQMLTALNDLSPRERADGIAMGFAFRPLAVRTVVYFDYGVSGGMQLGIDDAKRIGHPTVWRSIGKHAAPSSKIERAAAKNTAAGARSTWSQRYAVSGAQRCARDLCVVAKLRSADGGGAP